MPEIIWRKPRNLQRMAPELQKQNDTCVPTSSVGRVGFDPPFLFAEAFYVVVRDLFEIIPSLKLGTYIIRHDLYIIDMIMAGQAPPIAPLRMISLSNHNH